MTPRIYKYFEFNENLVNSLREGYLWFSDPATFNDPFEFKIQVEKHLEDEDILEYFELYKKLAANPDKAIFDDFNNVLLKYRSSPKKFTEFYLAPFIKHVSSFGVCCFSSIYDNILMWSHYADKHAGVVVEFDSYLLDESIYKMNNSVLPTVIDQIIYSNDFPIVKFSSSHRKTADEIKKVIFTKSIDWKYENEVRIVSPSTGKHLIDKKCIMGLYLGHKLSDDNRADVIELLSNYFPKQQISINEMCIDDQSYSLKIKNI